MWLPNFFKDIARILRSGGLCLAAIDAYVGDAPSAALARQLRPYLEIPQRPDVGLQLLQPASIDGSIRFSCRYATNSDITMHQWNRLAPALKDTRIRTQSVSIKAVWRKPTELSRAQAPG